MANVIIVLILVAICAYGVKSYMKNVSHGCCGSGGSFNLKYYELSRQINRQKTAHIAESGAEVVVVGCPACLMHIKDGLAQDGIAVETRHIVELLAESYGLHQSGKEERV